MSIDRDLTTIAEVRSDETVVAEGPMDWDEFVPIAVSRMSRQMECLAAKHAQALNYFEDWMVVKFCVGPEDIENAQD